MSDVQLVTLKNIDLSVRRATAPERDTADGTGSLWASRDGSLITMPWLTAMAMEGRVFNTSHASPDTKMTAAVNYDATHPSVCIVVPAGVVMIPVSLNLSCEDMAGTDNHVTIITDAGDLYSSGGTACAAVTNLRTDSPYSSALTKVYASDSAITATDPGAGETNLFTYFNAFADATTSPPVNVNWAPAAPPVLVGPASFLVYVYGASTAAEYGFAFQWVELPKNSVV